MACLDLQRQREFNNEGFESASLCANFNQLRQQDPEQDSDEHNYTEISNEGEGDLEVTADTNKSLSQFLTEVFLIHVISLVCCYFVVNIACLNKEKKNNKKCTLQVSKERVSVI